MLEYVILFTDLHFGPSIRVTIGWIKMSRQINYLDLGMGADLGCVNWLASILSVTKSPNSSFGSRPTNKNLEYHAPLGE